MEIDGSLLLFGLGALAVVALYAIWQAWAADGSARGDYLCIASSPAGQTPEELPPRVLLAVGESSPAVRDLSMACRIGDQLGAEIVLAYVVPFPEAVPLDVPIPAQEATALQTLSGMEVLLHNHDLPVRSYIVRSHTAGNSILQLAQHEAANIIVLGMGTGLLA